MSKQSTIYAVIPTFGEDAPESMRGNLVGSRILVFGTREAADTYAGEADGLVSYTVVEAGTCGGWYEPFGA
jgi:hypothetical protein